MPQVQKANLTQEQLALQSRIMAKNALIPHTEFIPPKDDSEEEQRAWQHANECIQGLKPFEFQWRSDKAHEEYNIAMKNVIDKQMPQLAPILDFLDSGKMIEALKHVDVD